MIIHKAQSRGKADHGWLKSHHTFSFADYHDDERMHFGALRVINDDYIAPGTGFGTHPHRDMEIITIPLTGAVQHKDSTGTSSVIRKGEVQIMSAGTGILHSEYNASATEELTLLQIWVLPAKLRVGPRYEQKVFSHNDRKNKFVTVVSPDGREGSVTINQNAFFSLVDIELEQMVSYQKKSAGNGVYIFIISGKVLINGESFEARDGVGIEDFESVELKALAGAEVLMMEVPV